MFGFFSNNKTTDSKLSIIKQFKVAIDSLPRIEKQELSIIELFTKFLDSYEDMYISSDKTCPGFELVQRMLEYYFVQFTRLAAEYTKKKSLLNFNELASLLYTIDDMPEQADRFVSGGFSERTIRYAPKVISGLFVSIVTAALSSFKDKLDRDKDDNVGASLTFTQLYGLSLVILPGACAIDVVSRASLNFFNQSKTRKLNSYDRYRDISNNLKKIYIEKIQTEFTGLLRKVVRDIRTNPMP